MPEPARNPYEPPSQPKKSSGEVTSDPSIDCEPHYAQHQLDPDASEARAERELGGSMPSESERVDHSVWDEPALSPGLTGPMPDDALTYQRWLSARIAENAATRSWKLTTGIASLSGLFAIAGAMFAGVSTWNSFIAVCVIGPVTEEIMKVALAIWVVEKHPYLFKSAVQILTCAFLSGLVFAAVENILYLRVYIPNPEPWLIGWRWTVCVAMHTVCSTTAGVGVMRIWRDAMTRLARPQLKVGTPYFVAAIVIHGLYNLGASLAALSTS